MDQAPDNRWRRYGLYALIWTVVGLFLFSRGLTQRLMRDDPTPRWHYFVSWMLAAYVWAALTPAMLWLGRRFPIERRNWPSRTLLHLVFGAFFSVLQIALESIGNWGLGLFPPLMATYQRAFLFVLPLGFHNGILTYGVVLAVQWGLLYYQQYQERARQALALELRASELHSQMVRARLSAMRMQLQPHFLFNTLNAIVVLVRQQKGREAEQMLANLSDLLRGVLDDVEAEEVSLQRELEYVQLYLSIEQVRFKDRLRVEIAVDADTRGAAVPPLGLQPIVENAIRHGLGGSASASLIRIGAAHVDGMLQLRVEDDGPGFLPGHSPADEGIGLSNTRARLRQLYGARASLDVANVPGGGAVVTLTLPYRLATERSGTERMEVHAADRADR